AAEATLRHKRQDVELARQQAELDKITIESEAAQALMRAKANAAQTKINAASKAEEIPLLARAEAERARAANEALTPLAVMMHGYDALKELGGSESHIYLGDWSKLPN